MTCSARSTSRATPTGRGCSHRGDGDDLRLGDLITYGDAERATHVAFWLGNGRILHSTEREDVNGVLEEPEPATLHAQRRRLIRLG
jgi:cell wall-associated NlpC family hydrolase